MNTLHLFFTSVLSSLSKLSMTVKVMVIVSLIYYPVLLHLCVHVHQDGRCLDKLEIVQFRSHYETALLFSFLVES